MCAEKKNSKNGKQERQIKFIQRTFMRGIKLSFLIPFLLLLQNSIFDSTFHNVHLYCSRRRKTKRKLFAEGSRSCRDSKVTGKCCPGSIRGKDIPSPWKVPSLSYNNAVFSAFHFHEGRQILLGEFWFS